MSTFVPEKRVQAKAASHLLLGTVRDYFRDEQHRREFESWFQKRHGKPYEWKEYQHEEFLLLCK